MAFNRLLPYCLGGKDSIIRERCTYLVYPIVLSHCIVAFL